MKNKKVWYGAGAIVIVILVIWFLSGGKKEQKVEFETAKVERQDIHTSIGTQVSGIVAKLYVDYNSIVKKGQVIAELDKTNLISELNRSRADLTSAQSTLNYEQANFNRYKTLHDKGLVSADEFESARLSYEKARQTVASSRDLLARVFARPRPIWAMPPSPRLSMAWYSPKPLRKARPLLPLSTPQSSSPLPRT